MLVVRKIYFMKFTYLLVLVGCFNFTACQAQKVFPDGKEIPSWFDNKDKLDIDNLGKRYNILEYGCSNDSNIVQTQAIQKVIDTASLNGGGVIVIPKGTFLSGSLFFKQGTHLHIESGGQLKGSDRIWDFKVLDTRIEGRSIKYFAALVNADKVDGFTISGGGVINGNGWAYWKEFWIRRQYNPDCTNLEAMRPRLVFVSNSKNVTIQDICLSNSPFWTSHIYKCEKVRFLDCTFFAPSKGVFEQEPQRGAPSTDGIDIDVCHDILISGCNFNVNDDAIALKGGKGAYADEDENNGSNSEIIVENCSFSHALSCLTIGSESVYDKNVILRDSKCDGTTRVLRLKFRPDTPQHFEFVNVGNISGNVDRFLSIRPWTQFVEDLGRKDMPLSRANNFFFEGIDVTCNSFFDVEEPDQYYIKDFTFSNSVITDYSNNFDSNSLEWINLDNFNYNGQCLGCTQSGIKHPNYRNKSLSDDYDLRGIKESGNIKGIRITKGTKCIVK